MKHLTAAAVCIAFLYGVDAIWFNGWYFEAINQALSVIWTRGW